MIRELPESEGNVLGFEITSKVSLDEEKEWIGKFDKAIEDNGKVSALVVLGEDASWGVKAGLEDLKWVMKHMKQLDKIAVVSDSNVWKWLVALDSPFAKLVGISEKHFEPSELDDAWTWVKH
ncbi:MAG: STAS/SEC14 domain-containing protein [Pseudomonadota bacterium]|nr:MAG: STAS/SEC14 domain-containing protein [Pseudomonadota bacterium]